MTLQPLVLLAAEVTEKSGGLFDFDATLPIMALQFLLLVAILNSTFFQPLSKAIDGRNDYIRMTTTEAKERLTKAQQMALDYEQETAETRKAAQSMVLQAQAEAGKLRSQEIAKAQAEAQLQVTAALAEIEQQKAAARLSLQSEVAALSNQILERLIGAVG